MSWYSLERLVFQEFGELDDQQISSVRRSSIQKPGKLLHHSCVCLLEMSSDGVCVLAPGESQQLDAFFKTQSIAAHRPPHIPALRMLPDLASPDSSDSLSFAMRMPQLPAIQPISERSSFELDEVQLRSRGCLNCTGSEVPAGACQRECVLIMQSPNFLHFTESPHQLQRQ